MKDLKIVSRSGFGNILWRIGLLVGVITLCIFISFYPNVNRTSTDVSQEVLKRVDLSLFDNDKFDIEYVENNLLTLDQTDPQLVRYTRIKYLTPPSKFSYNLREPGDHKYGFSDWVAKFFKNKRNGRFIEAGANEGEKASHTLYLEKNLGWSGLLIECNPKLIPSLKSHHRRAWIADVCLSTSSTPGVVNFSNPTNWTYSGTFRKPWNLPVSSDWEAFEVQTIPLFTVLAALGWTEVDYFSFDIEGIELSVLRNFPFDSFIFKLLIIEVHFYTEIQCKELHDLLTRNHYIKVNTETYDWYYAHNSIVDSLSPP